MIGEKRQRELMEDGLSRPQDYQDDSSESEEYEHPKKQQKTTNSPFTFSTTTKHHEVLAERVIVVAHTDAEAIQQLKDIERSSLP